MKLSQAFKMAWKSILSNKTRTLLTMLGIIIGVSCVILLVSVGQGATSSVTAQVQGLGSNLLTVSVTGRGDHNSVTLKQAMEFADLEGVQAVAPTVSGNVQAKNGSKNVNVSVEGITSDYEEVRVTGVQSGRFILPIDIDYTQKVALIGTETATTLFGTESPVGQYVTLNGMRFKIVGLLEDKSTTKTTIKIPLTSAQRLLRSTGIRTIYLQGESGDTTSIVKALAEQKLDKIFRDTEDSYTVTDQKEMLETVSSITDTLSIALGGIAGISLIVGGIGIMNIMLVSVTERTREIGIRKSVGAKKRDILLQFLIESIVISSISGIIGILIGVGGGALVSKITSMSIEASLNIILISFGFSVFIGVFFGIFPANKAANLKPVDALRYD
ncbi:ABC transporter permease [Paenibacillus selenitireducens]|uniref:ABC transporter permease n=1 Tax=Paenibacillus selenitireducens TaxID=1324314 RepID=A0A1T2XKA3_9BACL|nr:ABC transporter permease [Paenibacillus selenitireducens]OPA80300.1 ABC transporter permease [Paenibacillus selenitireducens]